MKKYSDYPLSFDRLTDFDYLFKAHKIGRLGKRHKKEMLEFEFNLFSNLTLLEKSLKEGSYRIKKYKKFYIYEPKMREIQAINYVDRFVQHSLCDNYLTPFYKKRLILCNCACQQGKGTHFARKMLKRYLYAYYKRYSNVGYILKCDIKKYFASIDHQTLKNMLNKIEDERVKALLYMIIDSYNADTKVGLPIGNQTSQIFGVVYLDPLDRLIKEKLQIKYYVRYMDDLILIHHDRKYLAYCLEKMQQMVTELKLKFNSKTQIIPLKNGVEFLGGRFLLTKNGGVIMKLRKQSKHRIDRNLKKVELLLKQNLVDKAAARSSLNGMFGHVKDFDSFNYFSKLCSVEAKYNLA